MPIENRPSKIENRQGPEVRRQENRWAARPSPDGLKAADIYNVVGVVNEFLATLLPRELGAGSRAPRGAGRSSQTLDAAPNSPMLAG